MHQSIALPKIELINIASSSFSPLISKCQIKVCYVSDEPNRNRSIITKETAKEMAFSLRGAPIVGFYNEHEGDFEEHNRLISLSNGKIEVKDNTRPYGFVDLNAQCWFQEFDDEGVIHEYLMTEGWIWTGQYPETKRILDSGNNQSMELDEDLIDAHWTKDANGKPQFFIINEAIISKLCILGEECEPCFEGSQITSVNFSFSKGFEENLFAMMKEIKEILNEGGASVFTRYAVEIGDSLWSALYSYIQESYPDTEDSYCSMYRIEGIYEEESQKFAILQNRKDMKYYRLNFSLNEEAGFNANSDLLEVTKDFVPASEAQFSLEDYEAYEIEYASKKKETEKDDNEPDEDEEKCPKCGKPLNECECEEEEEDKKDKYVLEEIPEYIELEQKYSALQEEVEVLKSANAKLETEISGLTEFKRQVERVEKEKMINETFFMLSDDDKEDVIVNIDTYSLEEIEAKLAILCVRKKVSFNLDEDDKEDRGPSVFKLDGVPEDSTIPAWMKAAFEKQKNM